MVLYGIYRNSESNDAGTKKELPIVVKVDQENPTKVNSEVYPVDIPSMDSENEETKDGNSQV